MKDKDTKQETTPDELMENFRGPGLKGIILFTIVVHAVLLVGTSLPAIVKSVAGKDSAKLSEEERIEKAVREMTASMKEIAEEHGVKPQDLSNWIKGTAQKSKPKPRPGPGGGPSAAGGPGSTGSPAGPGEPKSAIEEKIEKVEKGPTVPGTDDEEEDLFK